MYVPNNDLMNQFISEATGWDMIDNLNMQVYNAKLRIDIGLFKADTIVNVLALYVMDVDKMRVVIYDANQEYSCDISFEIKLGEVTIEKIFR